MYDMYSSLTQDIEDKRVHCKNLPFEVGSGGHLSLENKAFLTIIHKLWNTKTNLKHSFKKCPILVFCAVIQVIYLDKQIGMTQPSPVNMHIYVLVMKMASYCSALAIKGKL